MKTSIIFFLCFFSILLCGQSQLQELKGNMAYEVKGVFQIHQYNASNNTISGIKIPKMGLFFKEIGQTQISNVEYYIIEFEEITYDPPGLNVTTYVSLNDNNQTFCIEKLKFLELKEGGYLRERHKRTLFLDYGSQVGLPFKWRPSIDDRNHLLSPEIHLTGYIGGKIRLSKYKNRFMTGLINLGITSLDINEANTMFAEDSPIGESSVLGLGWSFGVLFELDGFQIGFISGQDWGTGDITNDWVYRGRQWYSFQIGYSFIGK